MPRFEEVLNSLLRMDNIDVYVTGSNSRFLSSDIVTEFRGRGDEIRIYPLSFAEFYSVYDGDYDDAWNDYMTYGGLPQIAASFTSERRTSCTNKTISRHIDYLADAFLLSKASRSQPISWRTSSITSCLSGDIM